MSNEELPRNYRLMLEQHPEYMQALSRLGQTVRQEGPLQEKTIELLQLVTAAALHLEGAVHSPARRALQAGASAEEIRHALIAMTSTAGFPTVAAAMSWARDVIGE